MRSKQSLPGLFMLHSKIVVNVFWTIDGESVTVIDTGFAGSADAILKGITACGRCPQDVRDIFVTHCHWDHAGSLAALQAKTKATIYMHPDDAALAREGHCARPIVPSPGLISHILFQLFINNAPTRRIEPARVDREIGDGEELPIAGGIRAIHVPGHCAGQLAFLWNRHGGVLFAADTAANLGGLGLSMGYENLDLGRQSLTKISALTFENACCGHGGPILGGADKEFRRLWPAKELVARR
jgi:glyoxylase-like metal-dependent hydrolase (beta-lactamase superfamily II)